MNQPVFFHCYHGINRTSMVQIAYRTKYGAWTLEPAADEIERTVGLVKVNHGPDYRHMVPRLSARLDCVDLISKVRGRLPSWPTCLAE